MVCLKAIDIIERVDLLEPNDYSPEQKLRWLSSLDGKILREVIETHEGAEGTALPRYRSGQETLLVQEPYGEDLYLYYIQAMIAAENNETQRYNKRMTLFNAAYQAWTNFYNRSPRPRRSRPDGSAASGQDAALELARWALETAQALRRDAEAGRFSAQNGEDGVSPAVTVTSVSGGHRVTITDAEHPEGQSFTVADGAGGSYAGLGGKPSVNGHTLASGDQSGASLGLVDAESGKGLSANDFTAALKAVVDALAALIAAANNGKVVAIQSGALAAVEIGALIPNGDEVSY